MANVTHAITLEGADSPDVDAAVERLAAEDALGQLLRRDGKMAALATEGGDVKLDWVDGVEKALAAPGQLEAAGHEAEEIVAQRIRHVIWSGMGGSVQTVYTLKRLGYLDGPGLSIHPLDSTDPAALNRILAAIGAPGGQGLAEALAQTMMIGVSMGMTSEEPITHLQWFDGLLREHDIADPSGHIQVMTLPDSYLDQFARARSARMVPIQLDGENHTPGRMSAPATRVFIRPIALMFAAAAAGSAQRAGAGVRQVLRQAQDLYQLSHGLTDAVRRDLTRSDPFVRLAAWLSLRADAGKWAPKLLVTLPAGWEGFAPWLEQLVEESLGKGGKGFLVFYRQPAEAAYGKDCAVLRIAVEGLPAPPEGPNGLPVLTLRIPPGAIAGSSTGSAGLGCLAGLFLGFEKAVAAYGYLQEIVFAGQPAVEAYKQYARDLREAPGPVALDRGAGGAGDGAARVAFGSLWLDYSSPLRRNLTAGPIVRAMVEGFGGRPDDAADVFAGLLVAAREAGSLRYLDVTWNGELGVDVRRVLERARDDLAGSTLGIPAKVRTGPSDYHSTEQGETDGPPELVSLRLVAARHAPVAAGHYDDKFLLAQARGTWQAMEDAGRWIVFLTLPESGETPAGRQALDDLERLFERVASRLRRRDTN
jgi:hypothetical protein